MYQFKKFKTGSPAFNKALKFRQFKTLGLNADDSLFAMSLRNQNLQTILLREIGNVSYNLDKSLSSFTDVQISKGLSHQQYTVSSSNKLADFFKFYSKYAIPREMSGMEPQERAKPGSNDGMQLADIIKKWMYSKTK
jgi:regulatory protein YycI of two-component signal transduction system YycFG